VRIVTPSDRTEGLVAVLGSVPNLVNLVVLPGVARSPEGDVVMVDVPTESANHVVALLRARGVDRVGSVTIERSGTMLSHSARAAEANAPGESSEAVVWAEVRTRALDETSFTASFAVMLILATLIAAVGILTDSIILVIGAVVIGPEYGPLIGLSFALFDRDWRSARRAARTLSLGLTIAVVATFVFIEIVDLLGRTPDLYSAGVRPLTQFISHPDGWSVVVAVLAAFAGTISTTQARSTALVGVFISVTTIPAAANIAVAAAHQRWDEASGAFWQLMLNLVVIGAAGSLTFVALDRIGRRRRRRQRVLP